MDSSWALFVATMVLVIITAWYAFATWRMAKVMKQQSDASFAPIVVVRLERRDGQVLLVLENVGRSSALDVQLSVDRLVPQESASHQPQNLSHDRLFQKPLRYLPGGSKYELVLGGEPFAATMNEYRGPFTLTVRYNWQGRSQEEQIPLEVHSLFGDEEAIRLSNEYFKLAEWH
jgi:hypothetical protein